MFFETLSFRNPKFKVAHNRSKNWTNEKLSLEKLEIQNYDNIYYLFADKTFI